MSEDKNAIEQKIPQKSAVRRVSPEDDSGGQELPQKSVVPCDLPEKIRKLIDGKPFKTDDIGRSGSQIFVFDDCVLKIVEVRDKAIRDKNDETVRVMRWLDGKLQVPKVLCYEYTYRRSVRVREKHPDSAGRSRSPRAGNSFPMQVVPHTEK